MELDRQRYKRSRLQITQDTIVLPKFTRHLGERTSEFRTHELGCASLEKTRIRQCKVQTVTCRAEDARSSEARHCHGRRRRRHPCTLDDGGPDGPTNRVRGGRRIGDAHVGGDGGWRMSLRVFLWTSRLCWTGRREQGRPQIHLDDGGGRGSICKKSDRGQ
jgi:hypothetical protein